MQLFNSTYHEIMVSIYYGMHIHLLHAFPPKIQF